MTLKVSTIEQTAETSEQKGGKGNTTLIMWDYNKDINVTLEDALFSARSMAIMFGNGKIKTIAGDSLNDNMPCVMKTFVFTATSTGGSTNPFGNILEEEPDSTTTPGTTIYNHYWNSPNGKVGVRNIKVFDVNGKLKSETTKDGTGSAVSGDLSAIIPAGTLTENEKYFCTVDIPVNDSAVIEISANTFPGTWTNIMSALAGNKIMLNYLVNCWKPYK